MLKRLLQQFIRIIQKIVITISLTVVYFIGLGLTWIFIMVFNRKILAGSSKNEHTFWVGAAGYQPDVEDSYRQS